MDDTSRRNIPSHSDLRSTKSLRNSNTPKEISLGLAQRFTGFGPHFKRFLKTNPLKDYAFLKYSKSRRDKRLKYLGMLFLRTTSAGHYIGSMSNRFFKKYLSKVFDGYSFNDPGDTSGIIEARRAKARKRFDLLKKRQLLAIQESNYLKKYGSAEDQLRYKRVRFNRLGEVDGSDELIGSHRHQALLRADEAAEDFLRASYISEYDPERGDYYVRNVNDPEPWETKPKPLDPPPKEEPHKVSFSEARVLLNKLRDFPSANLKPSGPWERNEDGYFLHSEDRGERAHAYSSELSSYDVIKASILTTPSGSKLLDDAVFSPKAEASTNKIATEVAGHEDLKTRAERITLKGSGSGEFKIPAFKKKEGQTSHKKF